MVGNYKHCMKRPCLMLFYHASALVEDALEKIRPSCIFLFKSKKLTTQPDRKEKKDGLKVWYTQQKAI